MAPVRVTTNRSPGLTARRSRASRTAPERRAAGATGPASCRSPPPRRAGGRRRRSSSPAAAAAPPGRRRRTGCARRSGTTWQSPGRAPRGRFRARRTGRRPRSARAARRRPPAAPSAAVDDADDRLQHGRADAVGAGAAEHELDLAVAHHDRRGHHARHAPAGGMQVEAERVQVLLAHHVVQVDARAGDDHARALAVGAGRAAGAPVARRSPRCASWSRGAAARKRSRKPSCGEPLEELRGALGLGGGHRADDRARASAARARGRAAPARRRAACRPPTAAGWSGSRGRGSGILHGLALDRAVAGEVARLSASRRARASQSQTAAAMSPL